MLLIGFRATLPDPISNEELNTARRKAAMQSANNIFTKMKELGFKIRMNHFEIAGTPRAHGAELGR